MKKALLLVLVAMFLAAGAHAQQGTEPRQQETILDAGTMRMMHQEMLHGMADLMERMNAMMEQTGRMVETAAPLFLQQMAQLMTEMSITLQDMSEQRATGAAFSAQLQELQERMREMQQMMDSMEKQVPNS
jgi:methyl-accepting chemotaxis protein